MLSSQYTDHASTWGLGFPSTVAGTELPKNKSKKKKKDWKKHTALLPFDKLYIRKQKW